MTWEDVDDARAARYRAVKAYEASVEAMSKAVEWDRDADVVELSRATGAAARNLYEVDQQYRTLKALKEEGLSDEG